MSQQCQCKNTSSNAGQSACQSKGDGFVPSQKDDFVLSQAERDARDVFRSQGGDLSGDQGDGQ